MYWNGLNGLASSQPYQQRSFLQIKCESIEPLVLVVVLVVLLVRTRPLT